MLFGNILLHFFFLRQQKIDLSLMKVNIPAVTLALSFALANCDVLVRRVSITVPEELQYLGSWLLFIQIRLLSLLLIQR
jgi:hypothetical protein